MNYEKFNDAMCRLRQAEEDFNKALQDIQIVFNEYGKELAEKTKQARWEPWSFDNVAKETKDQELQEKDDYYYKGLKYVHEALHIIAAEDGMSASDLKNAFGTCSICDIVLGFTSEEIIDKALEWKTKQKKEEKEDQELHVGDEITTNHNITGIVMCIDEETVWIIYRVDPGAPGFEYRWIYTNKCKKTGRHFDSIPFDYNPEKGD